MYISGKRLPKPAQCPIDIYQLMRECWDKDPYRRKQPQAIMRDINQLMYEGSSNYIKSSFKSILFI